MFKRAGNKTADGGIRDWVWADSWSTQYLAYEALKSIIGAHWRTCASLRLICSLLNLYVLAGGSASHEA